LSYTSLEGLRRLTDTLDRLRRKVELFTGVLEACQNINEARIATVDFLDPLLMILIDLVDYLTDLAGMTFTSGFYSAEDANQRIRTIQWRQLAGGK